MHTDHYIINQRFSIQEPLHTIIDLTTGTPTRLEARLMKLLHLLVQQQGQVVTRQQIIGEIWDNYGGAEDGLNQAISFLRKVLDDANKQLIRTVPKQGYILEAIITPEATHSPKPAPVGTTAPLPTPDQQRLKPYLLLLMAVLVVALILWWWQSRKPAGPWEPPGATPDTSYQHQEMKQQQ